MAAVPAPAGPVRSEVYAFHSAQGPASWAEYNRPHSVMVRPGTYAADPRYYFESMAELANEMGVDGVVFNSPNVRRDAGVPYRDLYNMHGRIDAYRGNNPQIADGDKIRRGVETLRRNFRGRIIFNCGHPDPSDAAFTHSPEWCDAYVRFNLGPYIDGGHVDFMPVDTLGSSGGIVYAHRTMSAVARCYPFMRTRIGAEPNALYSVSSLYRDVCPFSCSLTTDALLENINVFRGRTGSIPYQPTEELTGPVIVAYTRPRVITDFASPLRFLSEGRCVAIQPWTVGYGKRASGQVAPVSDADAATWREFMRRARVGADGAVQNPDPSTPASA